MADDYSFWRDALTGKFGPIHDGHPQPGFYRMKRKGNTPVPAAIWREQPDQPKMLAVVNGKLADAEQIWTWVCRDPISEATYKLVTEGHKWPDIDGTIVDTLDKPRTNHNEPPDDRIILADQIASAIAGVKDYGTIEDEDALARAQSLRSRLNELARDADNMREALKRPHLEQGKLIDKLWQPLVRGAKEAADTVKAAMIAYSNKRAAASAAREAAAIAEAARLAEERGSGDAPRQQPAPPLPPLTEPFPQTIKGAYGRAASETIIKVVKEVTDWAVLWSFLQEHQELKDLMFKLAQRAVNRGHAVPGVRIEEERTIR